MLTRLFSFKEFNEIDFRHEIIGGIVNFIAIAYIIVVNPLVLNANGHGFPINAAVTSTILVIVFATLLASMVTKLPLVLAPGMGINAIVGYTLILKDHINVPTVLGMILFSSVLLLIFSVTKVRALVINAIPECLQIGLGCGIGVFLFFIGVKNANIVVANPDTIVSLNKFTINTVLVMLGFILTAVLFLQHKKYSLLLPMIVLTIIAIIINPHLIPASLFRLPDFSLFLQMDVLKALKLSLLPSILSLFLVNFFDATSTVIGLLDQSEFSYEEKLVHVKHALLADSLSGVAAGALGSSPVVIFIESAAGIKSGAKTGFASVITALLCIPFLFLSPLIELVPNFATSPVLILVGLLMAINIRNLKPESLEDLLAVAVSIVMMPLTFSITYGVIFGILTYVLLKLCLGKFHDLSWTLVILAVTCLATIAV